MNSQKSVKRGPDGADFQEKKLTIASSSEALFMVKRGVKV